MALGLTSEQSLGQYHTNSDFKIDLIHYPAVPANLARSSRLARNPAHSDFGTLTLLFQDEVGGLEIADMSSTSSETSVGAEKDGKFIQVDPKPGTIIVNIGYLLMRWSNGRWKNTVHRVSEPPLSEQHRSHDLSCSHTKEKDSDTTVIPERYSIAYFSNPNHDTIIEALPACLEDQAPRWKPLNAGEYLNRKRAAMFV